MLQLIWDHPIDPRRERVTSRMLQLVLDHPIDQRRERVLSRMWPELKKIRSRASRRLLDNSGRRSRAIIVICCGCCLLLLLHLPKDEQLVMVCFLSNRLPRREGVAFS